MTSPDVEAPRRAILAEMLARVPFAGWTWATVVAGAHDAGFDAAMARRCFPRGLGEVLAFFVAEADRRMVEELARHDLAAMRVPERIALAVRTRLEQNAPAREAIRRALALQATPQYAPEGLAGLARTVDAMWRAAGDTATDFNYYTKRALLAGVYAATLLIWLDDRSPGFAATWAFLDRRIDEVMRLQRLPGRLAGVGAALDKPLKRLLARLGPRAAGDWQEAEPRPAPPDEPSPP
jgi:ubiquinone biosynthesis protein COQ9